MKYLIDASVLREATKPTPDPRVVAWMRDHEPDIAVVHALTVVTRNRVDFVKAGVRVFDPFVG